MFPSSLAFPAQEMTGVLVGVFWAYRAATYNFLHPRTFAGQAWGNPTLMSAICLPAILLCGDADIQRRSLDLQKRFFAHAITSIRAALDFYLPAADVFTLINNPSNPESDEKLDHLCEIIFAMCMVNEWAINQGMSTLHTQLTDIILRLSFAIGLHRDPPENGVSYGLSDPVAIFIRKVQRHSLWFNVSYFVLFAAHWARKDMSEVVVRYGEDRLFGMKEEFAFRIASLDPDFDPKMYEPPADPFLGRPLRHDDLFLFTKFAPGSPERQLALGITRKILSDEETYNWGTYLIYWRLRIDVSRLLQDCAAVGTTPGKLAVLDAKTARESEVILLQCVHFIDMTIVDILANLPSPMKEAENGAAAHPKAAYLLGIRLLRLELLSDFGLFRFDEIANGALNHDFASPRFWECLREAAIHISHTRHSPSRLHFPFVRVYGVTGPTVPKAGALSLAVLADLLQHAEVIMDESLLVRLKEDVDTVIFFLTSFLAGRPANSAQLVTAMATLFAKLMAALAQTPNFKARFGSDWSGLDGAPTLVEIKTAHLQQDIVAPEGEEDVGVVKVL